MRDLMVAPVTRKGQVTLPRVVRSVLRLNAGPDMVAFRIERNGKVEIVPVEIKQKARSPYSPQEWAQIEKLSNQKGKAFRSAEEVRKYLKKL